MTQLRLLLALLLAVLGLARAAPAQSGEEVVRFVAMPPIEKLEDAGVHHGLEITESLFEDWDRLRRRALAEHATVIVFEITTPGGDLMAMRRFVTAIEETRRQGIRTLAFVPSEAASAGAIIALACQELVLAPNAMIGNAIPLRISPGLGIEEAPAKIVTEVLALMSRIAREGRFDETLLHAMVDRDMEVLVVKDGAQPPEVMRKEDFDRNFPATSPRMRAGAITTRTIKARGSALKLVAGENTPGLPGFPYTQAHSRREVMKLAGGGDRDPTKSEVHEIAAPSPGFWKGLFEGTSWSGLLLIAGILFFILELKTPGLGFSGVLGILCLVVYFILNAEDGPPVVLTLGLLILGFFLLLVETLILPGFGVAGVAGVLLIVFSVYAATVGIEGDTFWDRVVPDEPAEWTLVEQWAVRFLGSLIVAVVGSFALARHLHHLPFLGAAFIRVPVLVPAGAGPSGQGAPGAVTSTGSVKVAVGAEGVCETDLRPAGKARFPQGIVDVVSQGEWIPRGTAVSAALVEGNRVVVVARGARA